MLCSVETLDVNYLLPIRKEGFARQQPHPWGYGRLLQTLAQRDLFKSTTIAISPGNTALILAYINLILEMATFCVPAENRL